jgi:hypothetical protein
MRCEDCGSRKIRHELEDQIGLIGIVIGVAGLFSISLLPTLQGLFPTVPLEILKDVTFLAGMFGLIISLYCSLIGWHERRMGE